MAKKGKVREKGPFYEWLDPPIPPIIFPFLGPGGKPSPLSPPVSPAMAGERPHQLQPLGAMQIRTGLAVSTKCRQHSSTWSCRCGIRDNGWPYRGIAAMVTTHLVQSIQISLLQHLTAGLNKNVVLEIYVYSTG